MQHPAAIAWVPAVERTRDDTVPRVAGGEDMRAFWDQRAQEDAFYFVDNRLQYGHPDLERFWTEGEDDLDRLLGSLGVTIEPSQHVLEIGCGVGRLTRVLGSRAASVRAVDVSVQMLGRAREHNSSLANVEWILGDGTSLATIASDSVDACVSHVVFQHIPDPEVTLGYVREIGRVLRAGGWAAFQISNDPRIHSGGSTLAKVRIALRGARRLGPRGQNDPSWRGSMVDVGALRAAAADGSMDVERVVGEGTQFCLVLTRRRSGDVPQLP
jgi:SAM-dependent methyltransferase